MDGSWIFFLLIVVAVIYKVIEKNEIEQKKQCEEEEKKREEAKMKAEKPEVWLRLQELEHEKKLMQQKSAQIGMGVGATLLRIFTGK